MLQASASNYSRELVSASRRKGGRKQKGNKSGRRPKQGRAQIYGQAYNQLRKDVGWLLSMVNVESKYVDLNIGGTLPNTWQYNLLNGMNLGNTSSTRNGQSVKTVGLECRWYALMNTSTTTSFCRIMIFQDTQPNAAAPGATDVYPAQVLYPRNVGYIDRFKILYEKAFTLNTMDPVSIISSVILELDFHTLYNTGNTGLITDITENALYFGAICDQATNPPSLAASFRYLFIDN